MAAKTATTTKPTASTAPLAEAPKGNDLVPAGAAPTDDGPDRDKAKEASKLAGASYLEEVFSGHRVTEITGALSNSIPFEAFKASVASAVMNNPDLLGCKPGLLFREVIRIARLGLVFDQQLGEAYLIAGYNWKTKKKDTPQARVGYRGLMKLARNEGVQMYAHEVRANDEFECILGVEHKLIHKPKVFATDRGDVIGFYAVAKMKGADDDFEPMSQAEVDAIRDRTEAYKAWKAGNIKSTPWQTDPVEMGKKTVIRRLTKRLPMGPKMSAAIALEDDAEGIIRNEREPQRPGESGTKALDNFSGTGKPRRGGPVTDIPPDDGDKGDGGLPLVGGGSKAASPEPERDDAPVHETGDPTDGGDQGADKSGDGGAYVEAEPGLDNENHPGNDAGSGDDEPAETSPEEKRHAELLALAPAMPAEAAEQWQKGVWMAGWKWINEAMRSVEDVEVRQALATEHAALLRAVMAKSAGYKGAAMTFLSANGVKIETEVEK